MLGTIDSCLTSVLERAQMSCPTRLMNPVLGKHGGVSLKTMLKLAGTAGHGAY